MKTIGPTRRKLYDISPPLSPRIAVWPGDTPMSRRVLRDMHAGANLTLSTLRATAHLGAHADAPSHYAAKAPAIAARSLDYYIGPCHVLRVRARRGAVLVPSDIRSPIRAERVLLHTGTYPNPFRFNKDFAALSPALVDFLHGQGVRLIGVDTPSVDPFSSKDLPAHHRLLRHDMANLEGLILAKVPAGLYELIAPPLKLVGFDASPVRAILRPL